MSNTTNDGGPAFPGEQGYTPEHGWNQSWESGMSKRELFAALAMQGMLADPEYLVTPAERADLAVGHADALLAALSRLDAALLAPSPPAQEAEWRFFVGPTSAFWYRVRATGTDELWSGDSWIPSGNPYSLAQFLVACWREVSLDELPAAARAAHEAEQAKEGA